jgi:D-3-phosphoglycerate dehydrogenase
LRVVGTASVGFDHVDAPGHVRVVNVPDYCTNEVADHTLALMLALLRGVVPLSSGPWNAKAAGPLRALRGLTVGVVGLGRIGSAVAARVRAFGCDVLAHDIRPIENGVPLYELLGSADIVTLHVPLDASTRRLIGRDELGAMKRDAVLVNTSRGAVVDLDALLAALRSGSLGGAALDVLPHEPPPMRPVAPNLIVTPHAAWYSEAAEERALRDCVARVREALAAA